ncbi:MAG: 3-oxoacyl-[acyl-carrier-protein] synthase [Streptomyces sp.]|jgi:3-oxoacyl-[acyl-carrier-protein] synthase-3|nr:3-oxoacyl-[acyl-carrier-protein] synthase [Streptomyces sp.]
MTDGPASFGVVGIAQVLGRPTPLAETPGDGAAAFTRLGYRHVHRAGADTHASDLAVEAARQALAACFVAPTEIDLLVVAVSDLADHLYWDISAAVQGRLGARRAEAVLVNQACGGGVTAFDTVAGRLATHPGYEVAVLVATHRVCEAYWDRTSSGTAPTSDGAVAVVLRRGHPRCRWLATETRTDGRYAGLLKMPGGTAQPFTAISVASPPNVGTVMDRLTGFFGADGRAAYEFTEVLRAGERQVLGDALRRVVPAPAATVHVVRGHDVRAASGDLALDLDVVLKPTGPATAFDLGHLGAGDQLIGLRALLEDGDTAAGDIVALVSTGSGAHWACTLLEI